VDLWPLRSLAFSLNLSAHGVDATVTRPAPDNTPIVTTGIWLQPLEESRPYGTDFQRREPRRVLVLPRANVPTLPRGSAVVAPETRGGTPITWRVDGFDRAVDPDYWRAIVVQ
jgi:hypothetical protein